MSERPTTCDHIGDAVTVASIRDTVRELAGGACFRDGPGDDDPTLVRDLPQPDGGVFTVLMHRGWLYSRNGSYHLTDAGRMAYLKSTDELGDGRLLHPREWRN